MDIDVSSFPDEAPSLKGDTKGMQKTLANIEAGVPAPQVTWQGKPLPEYKAPGAPTQGMKIDVSGFPGEVSKAAPSATTPKGGKPESWSPYLHQQFVSGVVGSAEFAPTVLAHGPKAAIESLDTIKGFPSPAQAAWAVLPDKMKDFYRRVADSVAGIWDEKVQGLKEALGPTGKEVPKTSTGQPSKGAEYAGKIAEFAGAGVIPGAGVLSKAENKLVAGLVEAASTVLGASSSVELGEGGKHLAKKLGIDEAKGQAAGEFIGSMLGPGLAMKAGQKLQEGGSLAVRKSGMTGLGEDAQKAAAKQAAVTEIEQSLKAMPQSQQNIKETLGLASLIPGFKPDIARASQAPGLVALKQSMMGGSPEALARGAQERDVMLGAIKAQQEAQFPEGAKPFTSTVGTKVEAQTRAKEAELKGIDRQLLATSQKFQQTGQAEVGSQLRALRDEKAQAAKEVARSKYGEAYESATKEGVRPDMAPVVSGLKAQLGDSATLWQDKPGLLGEVLRKYAPKVEKATPARFIGEMEKRAPVDTTIPFQEFHSLYKRANQELGEAVLARDWDKYRALKGLRETLGESLGKFEQGAGAFSSKFKEANRFYAQEVVPKFEKGIGGRMDMTGRFGETTPDEAIFGRLIKNPTGMKEYFGLYGDDQKAMGSLTRAFYDDFAKNTLKGGKVDPSAAERYLKQNKEVLSLVPEIQKKLASRTGMIETLVNRRNEVIAQRKAIDKDTLSKVLKTPDVEEAVKGMLHNPSQLSQVVAAVKSSPQASQSLAHSVATEVSSMPDPLKFLQDNAKNLKPVMDSLGPTHFDNLMTLAKAEEVVSRVKVPTHVEAPSIQDIGERLTGTPVKGIISQFVGKIRPSELYRTVNLGGRFLYKVKNTEVAKLREAALFNPDVAEVMASMVQGPMTEAKFNSLQNHLFSHGIKVLSMEQEKAKKRQGPDVTLEDIIGAKK